MSEATPTDTTACQADCEALSAVPPRDRMLLLPHCLRPSQGCPGKMTQDGLDCSGCSSTDCKVARLTAAARDVGYGNICIAPGGKLAVRRVKTARPAAIVAVACDKELEEGAAAVSSLAWLGQAPLVVRLPLTRDGCVDTDVDVDEAILVIQS